MSHWNVFIKWQIQNVLVGSDCNSVARQQQNGREKLLMPISEILCRPDRLVSVRPSRSYQPLKWDTANVNQNRQLAEAVKSKHRA